MTTINPSEKILPIFSIIIISFNTKQVTINCLQSIFDSVTAENSTFFNKYKLQIIVIDNASTDGSPQALEEFFGENTHKSMTCHLVRNAENTGFGKANNQGAEMAKGEYVFFLNSDTVVLENALEKFFDFYIENQEKMHFMGAKLLNVDNSPQPSAAPFYTPAIVFAALFLKGDYYGLTRYSPDHVKKVGWISGACILTKKNYFNESGKFDEGIFMYMER
jgi:GT2 family glycosyltransferase